MADIFMNWFINKTQSQANCIFIVLCYVVDLFLSFDHHKDIAEIFHIFKSTHTNAAFTKKLEENDTIPFLNNLIHRTAKGRAPAFCRGKSDNPDPEEIWTYSDFSNMKKF